MVRSDAVAEVPDTSVPPQTTDEALEQGAGSGATAPAYVEQAQMRVSGRMTSIKLKSYFETGAQYGPLPRDPTDYLGTSNANSIPPHIRTHQGFERRAAG